MSKNSATLGFQSSGKLSAATGVKVPTIRFYEQIGLLPEPMRTESDRRIYGEDTVRRLAFIRHTRQLGFEMDDIRALLALAGEPDRPCAEANSISDDNGPRWRRASRRWRR